ncbi:uncharacterized protein LOC135930101 [Gordionus sp. m RMFG-2023]|uniref:uncharacterized protein LOC135930101 n=1 Tax=Gordionus sp. m RMFG-2023 TaxID=3053472 RepID=UPI0031FE1BBA
MLTVPIHISLRFLRHGYLPLDYEKLSEISNNPHITNLKKQAKKGINEIFRNSAVNHLYINSEISRIQPASIYNSDWKHTIIVDFILHFKKTQTDIKRSQIYRVIHDRLLATKNRLGFSSHLYVDISSIPEMAIMSTAGGSLLSSLLHTNRECSLEINQGCGENADCRVSKGEIKCLCRIGFHMVPNGTDCTVFEMQNLLVSIETNDVNSALGSSYLDIDGGSQSAEHQDLSLNRLNTLNLLPEVKAQMLNPKYDSLFLDAKAESLGPPLKNKEVYNISLYLKSPIKKSKPFTCYVKY